MNTLLIKLVVLIFFISIYFYMQHNNKQVTIKESRTRLPTFIEAIEFSGSKKGYVFKMDSQGLGYYLDKK